MADELALPRRNVITTLICPLIGGVAMFYVVWLWDNRAFAAGYAANSDAFKVGP